VATFPVNRWKLILVDPLFPEVVEYLIQKPKVSFALYGTHLLLNTVCRVCSDFVK
jgi:hypothetical protein